MAEYISLEQKAKSHLPSSRKQERYTSCAKVLVIQNVEIIIGPF